MTINQLIKELMRIQTKHGKKIKVYRVERFGEMSEIDKPKAETFTSINTGKPETFALL